MTANTRAKRVRRLPFAFSVFLLCVLCALCGSFGFHEGHIMAKGPEPVVLELATLPREQIGPYLLLGLDKSADKEPIDANWADRVKWAAPAADHQGRPRGRQLGARGPQGDRQTHPRRRRQPQCRHDGRHPGQMTERYGVAGGKAGRVWQPLDNEKPLADYMPPAEVPDAAEVRRRPGRAGDAGGDARSRSLAARTPRAPGPRPLGH